MLNSLGNFGVAFSGSCRPHPRHRAVGNVPRHRHRRASRPHRHNGRRADDDAHLYDAPNDAILVLVCIYVGAIYGGSRSAILLNIPGTPASAGSTLDGYPLARQGLAGRAMGISTSGSWLGTLFGTLCVATLTPVLSEMALKFQSFEFFWIALFGIVIAAR